jgi:hypothetical protein
MAYEIPLGKHSVEAGQDLSAMQFYFMSVAADGQVDPTGAGEASVGVLQNKPDAAGKAAELTTLLISKVVAGEAIAIGASVASDASGKARTAIAGDTIQGIAMTASGADGNVMSVLLGQSRLEGDLGLTSGQDLSTSVGLFMAVAADGKIDPATAGVMCAGILQTGPAAVDLEAVVRQIGISDVISGAAFTTGDALASDSAGKAVKAVGNDVVQAIALETASAADETISVLLGQSFKEGDITLVSGADLSTKQFLFMAYASDSKIDPAGDGVLGCGVLQNAPGAADLPAIVRLHGITSVITGAAITAGDAVTSDSNGKAKTAATGDIVQGVALNDASGADETDLILLTPNGYIST